MINCLLACLVGALFACLHALFVCLLVCLLSCLTVACLLAPLCLFICLIVCLLACLLVCVLACLLVCADDRPCDLGDSGVVFLLPEGKHDPGKVCSWGRVFNKSWNQGYSSERSYSTNHNKGRGRKPQDPLPQVTISNPSRNHRLHNDITNQSRSSRD